MKVLAVGYAARVLEHTAYELRDGGCEVVSKLGCGAALQELSQNAPPFVVLDRSVPELSKLLLCRRILQLYPAVRVVVVTAGSTNLESFPAECVLVPASVNPQVLAAALEGVASHSGAAVAPKFAPLQPTQPTPTVTPPTAPPKMSAEH
jgi:DNA-binding NarL/FixJ family response regulator